MQGSIKDLELCVANARATQSADFVGLSTDSRVIEKGALFVALKGERFDAHDFLHEIVESGAAAVVAEKIPEGFPLPALIVPNTLTALGEIANKWRRNFNIPVIGVTGSNGKTTVKEMISSVLAAAFIEENRLTTRGNLNNEIGVPLTIIRLEKEHQTAVIEMGMNHPGEIARLTKIALPTIGLVNNAQREHQEFMHTVEAVARENGSVIEGLPLDGIAVFPGDDEYTELWKKMAGSRKVITFGTSQNCDVRAVVIDSEFNTKINVASPIGSFTVKLSTIGNHNVLNALAAIACSIAARIEQKYIIEGLESFQPVKGRLQQKAAKSGTTVIDDTYNANPDSVIAAIDVLANTSTRKVFVLGDMGEVGEQGEKFHVEIAKYAVLKGIDDVYVTGELTSHMTIDRRIKHFEKFKDMLNALDITLAQYDKATVLVKGSRFMKMERVVEHLIGSN
jgi:UDP-N-acetylmuramoyl-tripeptide--D-alanyl-D-alanine ligase